MQFEGFDNFSVDELFVVKSFPEVMQYQQNLKTQLLQIEGRLREAVGKKISNL
jgi:hypothetical protein